MASNPRNEKVEEIPTRILTLVDDFREGRLYIPEIQRDYVWSPKQVANFWDSLYRGLPIGGFPIVMNSIPAGTFPDGIETEKGVISPQRYLIDGQQRITSLEKVHSLEEEGHPNSVAYILFNLVTEEFSTYSKEKYNSSVWLPVGKIVNPKFLKELFFLNNPDDDRVKRIAEYAKKRSIPFDFMDLHTRMDNLKLVLQKNWSTVVMSDFKEEDIDMVFTRINNGGKQLKSKDLLKPVLVRKTKTFNETIKNSLDKIPEKKNFPIFKDLVIDALIWDLLDKQITGSTFVNVDVKSTQEVEKSLQVALDGILLTQEILTKLGVDSQKMIKSPSTLIPLIIYLGNKKYTNPNYTLRASETLNALIYFYILLNISNVYSQPNSVKYKTDAVIAAKVDAETDSPLKPLEKMLTFISKITKNQVDIEYMKNSGKSSFATHLAGFIAYTNGATGWGESSGIHFSQSDEHHIHPQRILKEIGFGKDMINNTANIVYATEDFNRNKMKDKEPINYRKELGLDPKHGDYEKVLVVEDIELWKSKNYEDFLKQNQLLRVDAINKFIAKHKPDYLV